ncbi:hypothetical protein BOTBODRAFT_511498 [Botryobasidium botryosum FD-172 SS1]|uniref:F-box domain-containing protein n=1 Tax=Botryobasidium botryosum (strain FD-172 SS1) TaxID=930990 RepID=A0A067N2Q8_BOTB1|nr:hypothetical protein BOTBODRAFT_511498 [Botryobasidium botryosum FD-172 SS1]
MLTHTPALNNVPIHRLPPEVTLEIFKAHHLFVLAWGRAALPMLRVAHVCRFWRHIIHQYRPFWSTISLNLDLCHRLKLDQQAAFWLARAGNELLDITITASYITEFELRKDQPVHEYIVPLARVLCESIGHWRSLDIYGSPAEIYPFFANCVA